jgi:hypothetical protein
MTREIKARKDARKNFLSNEIEDYVCNGRVMLPTQTSRNATAIYQK